MRSNWKRWEKKGDPHLMNRIQWGTEERDQVSLIFEEDWFGYGRANKELEKKLSEYTGAKHSHLISTGSAAIEIAIKGLKEAGRFREGDLIIHPITTFPTSISSAISYGAIPVFVETKENTYVIDPEQIEEAIKRYPQVNGAIIPHLIGNIPDMNKITRALDGRFLIEDCCDTFGGYFNGKHVGSFGDYGTFSFYASHHITTGGVGGALVTSDDKLSEYARSLIFWGRDFSVGDSFLDRYTYSTIGTDCQMSAIQAAFGIAQITRINDFIRERRNQFDEMTRIFSSYDYFQLPEEHSLASPSWFAYPLVVKDTAPFRREDFAQYFKSQNAEVRPIMCGNILRQKPYKNIRNIKLCEKFPIADKIQYNGLFVPAWGMPQDQREDYYRILRDFLENPRNY